MVERYWPRNHSESGLLTIILYTIMKEQVIEILKYHYGEIDIIDFEVEYQGALLTHVVLTTDEEIQFWSGEPIYSQSSEIFLDEQTTEFVYKLIIENF